MRLVKHNQSEPEEYVKSTSTEEFLLESGIQNEKYTEQRWGEGGSSTIGDFEEVAGFPVAYLGIV